jgi:hypothetical protein
MLNNHIHEAYIKAYQEYRFQETDKAPNLKLLDESRKVRSGINQETRPDLKMSGDQTVLFIGKGISWFIERMNSLFSSQQPCETC